MFLNSNPIHHAYDFSQELATTELASGTNDTFQKSIVTPGALYLYVYLNYHLKSRDVEAGC